MKGTTTGRVVLERVYSSGVQRGHAVLCPTSTEATRALPRRFVVDSSLPDNSSSSPHPVGPNPDT